MLKELSIKNYAVIENLNIEFKNGFNVITVETGAGITVLINAIEMILGARADSNKVLNDRSVILGVFEVDYNIIEQLNSIDIDVENPIIIKRVIENSGKSRAYINDMPVTVNLLKQIGNALVDIHGQYDHQLLLSKSNQIKLIDIISGNGSLINEFRKYHKQFKEIEEEINNAINEAEKIRKEREFIEYAYNELSEVNFGNLNESEFNNRLFELEHFKEIKESIGEILHLCEYDENVSLVKTVEEINKKVESIKQKSPRIENVKNIFDGLSISIEEVIGELTAVNDELHYDENELNELRKTAEQIDRLKRKYSMDLKELYDYRELIEKKIEIINFPEEKIEKLKKQYNETQKVIYEIAETIHNKRVEVSMKIAKQTNSTLIKLNMKDTSISIGIDFNKEKMGTNGCDDLEFLLINKYKPQGVPLKDIVSGGELSRIMLAIKDTISKYDPVELMIFDEIDTGIGGKTADLVAKLLESICKNKQIIAITHLPQIAARANNHILIEKKDDINISVIKDNARIIEIARMLGSSMSHNTAIKHAKALLKK